MLQKRALAPVSTVMGDYASPNAYLFLLKLDACYEHPTHALLTHSADDIHTVQPVGPVNQIPPLYCQCLVLLTGLNGTPSALDLHQLLFLTSELALRRMVFFAKQFALAEIKTCCLTARVLEAS